MLRLPNRRPGPNGSGRRAAPISASLLAIILAFGVADAAPIAQDVEEILSYDVSVEIEPGGSMLVTERIRVRALGDAISRGIFRDVPTSFPKWSGLGRIEAPFEVSSVTRDGSPEPFAVEGIGGPLGRGGMRIRIGAADVYLDPGVYLYEIRYDTDRWVSFGDEEDSLYWNVTGNGWGFPILSASVSITIPELDAPPRLESWTGPEGSTTTTATGLWDSATRTARFETDERLSPGSGLTVRASFPAGHLTPPTDEQREAWFGLDWGGYVETGYLVLLVIAVYLLMWRRVGIDPAPGPRRLRREPPEGWSPAALGFVEARGFDQRQLSAALVSMALKGAIRIRRDGSDWTLERLDQTDPRGDTGAELDPEERALLNGLLRTRTEIRLTQSHHATLQSAIKDFRLSLARRLERVYFVNNRRWFLAGLIVSVAGFALLCWRWRFAINPVAAFLGLWLTLWTAGTATLVWRVGGQLRTAVRSPSPGAIAAAGFISLFTLPFVGAEILVAGFLVTMVPSHLVLAAITVGATNVVFYHLLERPTVSGRALLDELAGFRDYLGDDAPESPRSHAQRALAERFLPFAIALGLEERWATAFGHALAPVATPDGEPGTLPWYHHDQSDFDAHSFSSGLGSGLSSTLSSASSPPRSGGGGGGGGGSSGGGGGGGGGGGW